MSLGYPYGYDVIQGTLPDENGWEVITKQPPNETESEDRLIPDGKLPGKLREKPRNTRKDGPGKPRRIKKAVNCRIMMGVSKIGGLFYYHDFLISSAPVKEIPEKWPKHIGSEITLKCAMAKAEAYAERQRR